MLRAISLISLVFLTSLSLYSAEKSYRLVDLKTGTVTFPTLFEQVRERLMKNYDFYSFKKGQLTAYRKLSESEICISFSNQQVASEMLFELEKYFVMPPSSDIPSAMEIIETDHCF